MYGGCPNPMPDGYIYSWCLIDYNDWDQDPPEEDLLFEIKKSEVDERVGYIIK